MITSGPNVLYNSNMVQISKLTTISKDPQSFIADGYNALPLKKHREHRNSEITDLDPSYTSTHKSNSVFVFTGRATGHSKHSSGVYGNQPNQKHHSITRTGNGFYHDENDEGQIEVQDHKSNITLFHIPQNPTTKPIK